MQITLHIEAQHPDELKIAMKHLAAGFGLTSAAETPTPAVKTQANKPAPAPTPVVETQTAATPEPVAQQPEPTPEPAPKLAVSKETVRAKLASLAQAGKQEDVQHLIASFGVSRLSDVPAERYGELMQAAEALL